MCAKESSDAAVSGKYDELIIKAAQVDMAAGGDFNRDRYSASSGVISAN
jgi:hypothetical protein